MKEIYQVLREVAANNNREWFAENKERWRQVDARVNELTQNLLNAMTPFEPGAKYLQPKDCRWRIYRDTRFSYNKAPYKTHIGIFVALPNGKKSERAGYYLHLEPGNVWVGGGLWCPEPKLLKAVRQEIYANVEEYLGIIENPKFRKSYPEVGADMLKTAPAGFPKDWEHIDLLKPRMYTIASYKLGEELTADQLLKETLKLFRVMKPYNDFLNYTVDEVYGPKDDN